MRRKLVKQGTATMMISLPSKWIKANDLGKGDEIDIEEKQNSIVISLGGKKSKRQTEINLTSSIESSVRTILTNAYRLGYDKINVNFQNKKTLKIIQNTVNHNLIGFEIIKKTDKNCQIENITEPSKEQFDNIFSKIFLNIDELFVIVENIQQGKKQEFEEIEQKIQQYDNFCRRVIAKNDLYDIYQLKWAFHAELIHGQRELYLLLKYLEKNKIKADKSALDLLEECKKVFEILKQAYKEKNIEKLEKIHDLEKEIIYKKGYSALVKSKDRVVIHHIISAIRNFYLASSPLIGTFI